MLGGEAEEGGLDQSLAIAYSRALSDDSLPLRNVASEARGRPAYFVGSGGAIAVAALGALLHTKSTGSIASAITPLQLSSLAHSSDATCFVISSSVGNPDAMAAIDAARRLAFRPVVLLTSRSESDLPPRATDGLVVTTVPAARVVEGFLARESVLALTTALVRAYCPGARLPRVLPSTRLRHIAPIRRRDVLVLFGPNVAPVAIDLETRLSELGLGSVQLADYRNFAHGRHLGLSRRMQDTTVVFLMDPLHKELALETLNQLPQEADVIVRSSRLSWPGSVLDLFGYSIRLTDEAAAARSINVRRPGVPAFGRRLYQLKLSRYTRPASHEAVRKKLLASGLPESNSLRSLYAAAYEGWRDAMNAARFAGLVLDYDGTVCPTDARFGPPSEEIKGELCRLFASGLRVGFASGRGASLHEALRSWVPRECWSATQLGLYNGGLIFSLAESVPEQQPFEPLREFAGRLRASPIHAVVVAKHGPFQARITPKDSAIPPSELARGLAELINWDVRLELKVVASAHSVDVLPLSSSKADLANEMSRASGTPVLCVGDQGQLGGNDFELLASSPFTLSVDAVSGDPTRCWNTMSSPRHGPDALLRYLRALRTLSSGMFAFRLR